MALIFADKDFSDPREIDNSSLARKKQTVPADLQRQLPVRPPARQADAPGHAWRRRGDADLGHARRAVLRPVPARVRLPGLHGLPLDRAQLPGEPARHRRLRQPGLPAPAGPVRPGRRRPGPAPDPGQRRPVQPGQRLRPAPQLRRPRRGQRPDVLLRPRGVRPRARHAQRRRLDPDHARRPGRRVVAVDHDGGHQQRLVGQRLDRRQHGRRHATRAGGRLRRPRGGRLRPPGARDGRGGAGHRLAVGLGPRRPLPPPVHQRRRRVGHQSDAGPPAGRHRQQRGAGERHDPARPQRAPAHRRLLAGGDGARRDRHPRHARPADGATTTARWCPS